MKATLISSWALCALSVSAYPQAALTAPAGHEFIAPGPNDSRSPCPGLNSLANHGFLPRSGRNIKVGDFVKACLDGLNVGPSFCLPIGIAGLQSNCTTATQMDLEQLQHHDVLIEHDGSLSRQDIFFGPDYPVNKRSYDMFIAGFNGASETSLKSASATRYGRINDSIHNNPTHQYGARELAFSYTETALYLQTMGRSLTSGVAPLKYITTFFGEERLPYEEGWTKGPEVTIPSLGAMDVVLQSMSPSPGDELIYTLTTGSVEELFEAGNILSSEAHVDACS